MGDFMEIIHEENYSLGLYTIKESALYAGLTTTRVNNWFFGYSRLNSGKRVQYERLIEPKIGTEDHKTITFRDLLEIRVMGLFSEKISVHKIRKAKSILQCELDDPYPFSSGKIKTDGKTLFCESASAQALTDIFSAQENMLPIIEKSLIDIEFEKSHPRRWWITGKDKGILIDPLRSFGLPIEDNSGIPTISLYEMVKSTKDLTKASKYFEVDRDVVQRAYDFHETLNNKYEHLH